MDPFLLPWLALPQSSLKIKERIGEDVNLVRGHFGLQHISDINAHIDTHYQSDQLRARYRERVVDGGIAAQVFWHQRTFGIENMGTPDAIVLFN